MFSNKRNSGTGSDLRSLKSDNSNFSDKNINNAEKLKRLQQWDSNPDVVKDYSKISLKKFDYPGTIFQNYVNQNRSAPYVNINRNSLVFSQNNDNLKQIMAPKISKLCGDSSFMIDLSGVITHDSTRTPNWKLKLDKTTENKLQHQNVSMSVSRVKAKENISQNWLNNEIPEFTLGPSNFVPKTNEQVRVNQDVIRKPTPKESKLNTINYDDIVINDQSISSASQNMRKTFYTVERSDSDSYERKKTKGSISDRFS